MSHHLQSTAEGLRGKYSFIEDRTPFDFCWSCVSGLQSDGAFSYVRKQVTSSRPIFRNISQVAPQQRDWVKFSSTDFAEISLNTAVLELDHKLWEFLGLNYLWCCLSLLSSPISSSCSGSEAVIFNLLKAKVRMCLGDRIPLRTADFKGWQFPIFGSTAHLGQLRNDSPALGGHCSCHTWLWEKWCPQSVTAPSWD